MAKTKTKKETLSLDEEMLMWTSYRYAIGRKTYVSSLAPYIGKKYYHLLNDTKAEVTAEDIRKCIADCLKFPTPGFDYDGTVDYSDRNAIADYLTWINNNVTKTEDLYNIKKVVCYRKGYGDKYPKEYEVQTTNKPWTHIYESDIESLLVWEDLASLFNRKNHVTVTVEYNGEVSEMECFYVWRKAFEPTSSEMFLKAVPWRFERRLVSVEQYLKNGEYSATLNEKYITAINGKETTSTNA